MGYERTTSMLSAAKVPQGDAKAQGAPLSMAHGEGWTDFMKRKAVIWLVEKVGKAILKLTDEGKSREQRRTTLEDYLSSRNITVEEIHEWLSSNHTTDSNYTFFLGYLNFSGSGTPLNINKAFDYFYKASSQDSPTAQYYLGICYEFGLGTTEDKSQAFKWYERSAKIGRSIIGKFALGIITKKVLELKRMDKVLLVGIMRRRIMVTRSFNITLVIFTGWETAGNLR